MKFIIRIIILNCIIINFIQSILVFPLKKIGKIRNLTNSYEFINSFQPNDLYTFLKIGEPSQDLEILIKELEIPFSISSTYCSLKTFYNKNASKAFRNITQYNGNIVAAETIYAYTDLNLKNLKKFENVQFIYEQETKIIESGKEIYNNCGVISTEIFRYNNNKYNLIYELKELDYINDYSWTIKYIENNINDIEGFLIIGDYPHVYENKNYNKINLRAILNNLSEKGWNLEFKNITTNGLSLNHYIKGIISFSTSYIIGTEEYKSKVGYIFFNQYINKNICFEDPSNTHYIIYYCKSDKFTKADIDEFPSLNFYHYQFNYTFSFTGADLFLESNGYYYFLIIFDRYNYQKWNFGKIFLKKYPLVFNPDSKMISFYIDYNNNLEEKETIKDNYQINNKTMIITILVIIGIVSFIGGLIIGSIIYKKKKEKKLSANEMKEDNFYEKRESLNDSENEDNKNTFMINS